jgi:hypothetical protein
VRISYLHDHAMDNMGASLDAMAVPVTLSLSEARRLAIASQSFDTKPATPSVARLRKLAKRLHSFQIDSVKTITETGGLAGRAFLIGLGSR